MHGTKADKLYDSAKLLDVKAQLDLGECGVQEVAFYHEHRGSVDFVFVDHPVYHRPGVRSASVQVQIERFTGGNNSFWSSGQTAESRVIVCQYL